MNGYLSDDQARLHREELIADARWYRQTAAVRARRPRPPHQRRRVAALASSWTAQRTLKGAQAR